MRDESKDKTRYEQFSKLSTELDKWPEDRVKTLLKERLEKELWAIIKIAMGTEQGKDLEATKNSKAIHIEAKGEPKSISSYRQERRQFVGGALISLITHMTQEDENIAYCMAFPDNDYYLRGVLTRIPSLVRKKLRVFGLFLREDSSIQVLYPSNNNTEELRSFDDLFHG